MKAKYDGKCRECGVRYEAGTDIVASPPRGRRRKWLIYHDRCHKLRSRGGSMKSVKVRFECPLCGGEHPRHHCPQSCG